MVSSNAAKTPNSILKGALLLTLLFTVSGCGLFGGDDDATNGAGDNTTETTAEGDSSPSTTSSDAAGPGRATSTTVRSVTSTTQVFLQPQSGGASIGDPLFPGLGNTGYDVLHYDLDLISTGGDLRGEAELTIVPDIPLTSFNLDFVGMTVDRVFVNGIDATTRREGRELIITPAVPIPEDQEARVRVQYRGAPDPIEDPVGPIALGWHTEDWGSYVASEPLGAATWFPTNDHPQDKATFQISVTVPLGQVAAGPGLLVSETATNGNATFVWEMNDQMAPYLASVVIGDFAILSTEGTTGVLIRNVLPTEQASQLVPSLAKTNEMIDHFSELFGPYPFDSYGVVAIPEKLTFALENQTLSLFDTSFLSQRRRSVENVLAHELAHQWFGNNVSPTTWNDIWLSEGFASWADHYWTERDGGETFDQREQKAVALSLRPPTSVEADTLFDRTVYLRGALTLEALRRTIGDAEFFVLLQTWTIQHQGSTASTDDFLLLVQQQAGPEIEALMVSWLFDPVMPALPPKP